MPNQYVNKVVQSNGTTLIDISDTTAIAADVASGKYFYLASGEKVAGTASGGATLTTKSITANGTYNASSDNADGYSSVTVNVPHVGPQFALIGQSTHTLSEYTNTSTAEIIDTEINIKNTDYVLCIVVITCNGVKTNAQDWGGLTIGIISRYKSNKYNSALYTISTSGFRDNTLSFGSMTNNPINNSSYGVFLANNTNTVKFQRKAHGTACPNVMAGTYTVKVYGITAL